MALDQFLDVTINPYPIFTHPMDDGFPVDKTTAPFYNFFVTGSTTNVAMIYKLYNYWTMAQCMI